MTRSVYILGGAGAGKSTFMAELLGLIDAPMSPLGDLHMKRNARGNPVVLRGHLISPDGLYIGCMRELFPGTDGLDRASSIAGEEWLEQGKHKRLGWIVAEGSTLSTSRFLTALHEHTELLLIHLHADSLVTDLRFLARGSSQDDKFVQNTVTRSSNLLRSLTELGARALSLDTADPAEWNLGLAASWAHLKGTG